MTGWCLVVQKLHLRIRPESDDDEDGAGQMEDETQLDDDHELAEEKDE